jgi:tyrosine-protein kinase Etk/Wzc
MAAQKGLEDNYIVQLLFKYLPYWPLFLLFAIMGLGISWYQLQKKIPLYSASASILIKDQLGDNGAKGTEELNPITPINSIENEMEVIKSKSLMMKVVKNLDLYSTIFEESRFVALSAYQTSPVIVKVKNPDSLTQADKVYFTYDKAHKNVIIENTKYPLDVWTTTKYGVLRFEANPYQKSEPKGNLYFSLLSPDIIADSYADNISVGNANRLSAVLNLSMSDENPQRAANILNELLAVYLDNIISEKKGLVQKTLKFVDDKLASAAHELDSIQKKVEILKRNGAIDLSAQGSMYLANVNENDQKIGDVSNQLAVLDQVASYVRSKDGQGSMVPSQLGIADATLAQLLSHYNELDVKLDRIKKTSGENHPSVKPIETEIDKIRPSILENIESQRRNLQANRSSISSNSGKYNSMLSQIPQKERELIDISREQNIKSGTYSFLLKKKEDALLSLESVVSSNKVISPGTASFTPYFPNARKSYMTAVFLAFILCISLIVGNEMLSGKILYRHEIENATVLPVIGEIGYGKTRNLLMTDLQDSKDNYIAEQFRKLRTSLTFLGIGTKRKKIVITSSIPGEGKSFVVANLGLSLAMAGKKVMLLEFDMVNPTLSSKLYINEEKGLSNYLIGENRVEEIIKKTEVNENLFVIPSGPLPDNPSEMIMSEKVQTLLTYLEAKFDYIIIDTAPVGPMTDAYILSSYCDATLYVVRHKYTPKVFVRRIDEENKINQLKNTAIIFNGVKSRGFGGNSYGYGYGYSYSYKYNYKSNGKRKKLVQKKS